MPITTIFLQYTSSLVLVVGQAFLVSRHQLLSEFLVEIGLGTWDISIQSMKRLPERRLSFSFKALPLVPVSQSRTFVLSVYQKNHFRLSIYSTALGCPNAQINVNMNVNITFYKINVNISGCSERLFILIHNQDQSRQDLISSEEVPLSFLTIALSHEDKDYECRYECEDTTELSACPYKGVKLIQKIRLGLEFSQEDKDLLRRMLHFLDPTDKLMEDILNDEGIAAEYEKLLSYVDHNSGIHKCAKMHVKRINELVHKYFLNQGKPIANEESWTEVCMRSIALGEFGLNYDREARKTNKCENCS